MQDYPLHIAEILQSLHENRLGLFSDAELDILERDLFHNDGDQPLRELLRNEVEWARRTRKNG